MTPAPLLAVLAAPERDCGSDVNDIASCSGTLPLVGIVVVWAGLLVAFVLLPAVLLTTSVVPFLGSWFERVALGLGPETPAAPPQTAPSEVPAPGTLPPPDAPLPGVPAEPQIAPDGVPPPGVPATPGSRPGADSPAETEPSASPRPEPAVEPSPHRPPAPSPGPWPGDPETTGPNAVDEGRGDETPGSDRGDGRDLPARFDEGFEPDENEPFFDPAELTPQQNIARDLLYKLTVYGGNLTPRAEIVANFLATLAEQSGPDRVARARRLAAMAAAAVQDLPAVVERLLGQFLNNGAVVEEEIGKPGLEDKAARVMATLQALVNEHNQVKAATERRGDPQDIVKAAEKLVPAAKEAQKRIADFVATGFSRLGDAAERDARAKARIDLARRTVYGNQDLGFLVVVSAIAEWFMRRSRVKELREKWSREERAAADAEGTDDDDGHDDDSPPDGDGDGDTDGDRGPKGGRR